MAAPHRARAPLLLLLSLLFFSVAAAETGGATSHLHFYFHELFSGGPNGTTAQLTQPRGGTNNGSYFGAVGVVDDMLREGADPSSRLLGRAQGLAVGASLSDGALLTMLNFVFTDGPYNGSTLEVFGRALLGTVMERPIIGGTGAFRMARGYTLSKMVKSPDPNNLLILEYDAYIWH
ncbi:dirigent protein 1-like [Phragmites australis]|uniref:dirigent protein 1-like n=1 Tax=Phragmites australis TaxID=29695 RepID=UPI002D766EA3|nr:dirigent protein 1-like [Phragmites australis]